MPPPLESAPWKLESCTPTHPLTPPTLGGVTQRSRDAPPLQPAAAIDSPSKVAAVAVKDAVAAAAVKESENADGHHFKGHDGTMGRVSETQRCGPTAHASSSPRSSSRYTGWSRAAKGAPRVDLTADDGGFGEWFDNHWAPKVAERAALRNKGRPTPRSN